MPEIFDPGPGWNEIPNGSGVLANALVLHNEDGYPVCRWIREEPTDV